uniref:Sulfotransferase domain-containing protein n=1 Tax=Pseudo-nitzschia australis TaxID=44445 RepID=A0A7S4AIF9_9STRA
MESSSDTSTSTANANANANANGMTKRSSSRNQNHGAGGINTASSKRRTNNANNRTASSASPRTTYKYGMFLLYVVVLLATLHRTITAWIPPVSPQAVQNKEQTQEEHEPKPVTIPPVSLDTQEEHEQKLVTTINGIEFVKDIDETGHFVRVLKHPLPVSALKLPTPIFLLSPSKSGTTTFHQYAQCGLGIGSSAHYRYPFKKRKKLQHVGRSMSYNLQDNRPLLQWNAEREAQGMRDNLEKRMAKKKIEEAREKKARAKIEAEGSTPDVLDHYQVFSDFDYRYGQNKKTTRLVSIVDMLDNIRTFYPNATIVYVKRDAHKWYHSAKNFGTFLQRLRETAEVSELVETLYEPVGRANFFADKEELWVGFYNRYTDLVRNFAAGHGDGTNYLEVPLDDDSIDTGLIMQQRLGIPKECWGHANMGALNGTQKGLKTKMGMPKTVPRHWTIETYK